MKYLGSTTGNQDLGNTSSVDTQIVEKGYTTNTGTITSIKTTEGSHSTVNVNSGAVNISIPTKVSHLTNDSGFLTPASTLNAAKLNGAIPSTVTATTQTQGNNSTSIATTAFVANAIKNTNLVNGSANYSIRGTGTEEESSNYTIGQYAFAEGRLTIASGLSSHAEGYNTTASGIYSHAAGSVSVASGTNSFAGGLHTIAQRSNQTVIGKWNIADPRGSNGTTAGKYAFIIGNGQEQQRSNAFAVDWEGNTEVSNNLIVIGNTEISKYLTVRKNTEISNNLTVGGNAEILTDLTVNGNTEILTDLTVGRNIEISNDLTVDGKIYSREDTYYIGYCKDLGVTTFGLPNTADWTVGANIGLTPGSWILTGNITIPGTGTASHRVGLRITQGTADRTPIGSSQKIITSGINTEKQLNVVAIAEVTNSSGEGFNLEGFLGTEATSSISCSWRFKAMRIG